MFTSVIPGDLGIHFPFQVLCLLIILLRHTYGFENNLFSTLAYNLYVNIKLGSVKFGGAADLESNLYGT